MVLKGEKKILGRDASNLLALLGASAAMSHSSRWSKMMSAVAAKQN